VFAAAAVALALAAAHPVAAPTWSPDGSRIAWAQVDGSGHDIWTARADGTKPRLLAPKIASLFQLDWLPDGSFLYVANFRIFRVGRNGVPVRIAYGLTVSIDRKGKEIAFQTAQACSACHGPIEVAPLAGGHARRIGGDVRNTFPSLSPDGRTLAFAHESGIWLSPTSGGALKRLAPAGNCPQWDPNGKRVAYANNTGLHVVDRTGTNDRVLLHGRGIPSCAYAWSPSGAQVAAVNPRGHLFMVDAGTGTSRQMGPAHTIEVAWSPNGARLLLTGGQTAKACSALWSMKPDGSGLHVLRSC
jgi:Tol biopolymer transport system component